MDEIGLRDLKNRLSEYVNRVKAGDAIVVTDRGQPVAELRPISPMLSDPVRRLSLDDLIRSGLLSPGKPNAPELYPALKRIGRRPSSELLDEERGKR